MAIDRLQLLRNVGQFDSVNAGAQIPLAKLALIYAENGRGKTTLAAILRSAGTNEPHHVTERWRLGAAHQPHIVLGTAGGPVVHENGTWSAAIPHVAIFDDAFVAANVCSGIEIETTHRQKLHELILGAQGVTLNARLQGIVARIEEHNRTLRQREAAIPAVVRGDLSVEEFCVLSANPNIEALIGAAERNLSAARSADAIRQRAAFAALALPGFDIAAISAVLGRTLADLEAGAAARVRAHLKSLGRGGEAWVGEGMVRIAGAAQPHGHETCPFCAQEIEGSPLIRHYQAYFGQAYEDLKSVIVQTGQGINTTHGGEVPAAFERSVRIAAENRSFWGNFIDVPAVDVDTAATLRAWIAARDAVLTILRAKAAAPLERMALPVETVALIDAYKVERDAIGALSVALQSCNWPIAVVKEQAAAAKQPYLDCRTDAVFGVLC